MEVLLISIIVVCLVFVGCLIYNFIGAIILLISGNIYLKDENYFKFYPIWRASFKFLTPFTYFFDENFKKDIKDADKEYFSRRNKEKLDYIA